MKFKKIKIEEDACYLGKITAYTITEDKRFLRIWVVLDVLPNIKFLKSVRYCEIIPSPMANLCEMLGIVDEDNNVFFDELVDKEVIVNFNLGKDGNYYINEMELYFEDEEYDES